MSTMSLQGDVVLKGDPIDYLCPAIVAATGELIVVEGASLVQVEPASRTNSRLVIGIYEFDFPRFQNQMGGRARLVSGSKGYIYVADTNGDVKAGDLIQAGLLPGVGERQSDDIRRTMTVGKALQSANFPAMTDYFMHDGKQVRSKLLPVLYLYA